MKKNFISLTKKSLDGKFNMNKYFSQNLNFHDFHSIFHKHRNFQVLHFIKPIISFSFYLIHMIYIIIYC